MWNMAIPAESKIRELEAKNNERSDVTLVSGVEKVMESRIKLINNAKHIVEVYSSLSGNTKTLCSELRQAWKEAIARGVQTREITEVTRENLFICNDLIDIGIDLRHLNNVSGVFATNEKELLLKANSGDTSEAGLQYIYSNFPLTVEQHRSVFNNLWSVAVPASSKIRELQL